MHQSDALAMTMCVQQKRFLFGFLDELQIDKLVHGRVGSPIRS
jgi:hypothetical protein